MGVLFWGPFLGSSNKPLPSRENCGSGFSLLGSRLFSFILVAVTPAEPARVSHNLPVQRKRATLTDCPNNEKNFCAALVGGGGRTQRPQTPKMHTTPQYTPSINRPAWNVAKAGRTRRPLGRRQSATVSTSQAILLDYLLQHERHNL